MLLRYSIFNSICVFVLGYALYFHDVFGLLLAHDPTRFTFLIFGIYVALTAYLFWKKESANFKFVKFMSDRLSSIGLIGTAIGVMILLQTVGTANVTEITQIVGPLFLGMGTVLVTTVFGLGFSLLMDFQVTYVFGESANDEQTD